MGDAAKGDAAGTPSAARRVVFTIASAKVTEELTDFPVYVELVQPDLTARLDAAATQLSFKRRNGSTVDNLAYELQSFDRAAGRLRAWVRLPLLSNAADTVFELQYGAATIASAPNAPLVWSNHFKVVFHLEGATAPIVDSTQGSPGMPVNLQTTPLVDAKLGKGVSFDGNSSAGISFTNPLTGNTPSTISVWVSQRNANNKDALIALGTGTMSRGRWLYGQFNTNEVGLGLFTDDWQNTSLNIENAGWTMLHWTYQDKVSKLFRDGAEITGSPHTHINNADTQGADGWLGGSHATGYDANAGLNGSLDEVRIADLARSPGWIAAEYANQFAPTTFVSASQPQLIP